MKSSRSLFPRDVELGHFTCVYSVLPSWYDSVISIVIYENGYMCKSLVQSRLLSDSDQLFLYNAVVGAMAHFSNRLN
jgi:hypothetical protein